MHTLYQHIITAAQAYALPAIRQIYIADANDSANKNAKFGGILLEDGTFGLTYTKLGDAFTQLQLPQHSTDWCQHTLLEVAALYLGEQDWQRVLGMAALNAISQFIMKQQLISLPKAIDTFELMDLQAGDHVGMVGYFPPLIETLNQQQIKTTVIELKPELVGQQGNLTVTLDPSALRQCNKILLSGTTIINHTLESLLEYTKQADEVVLIGPSVGLLPSALFELGITAFGGRVILDSELFISRWQQGEKWQKSALRYALHR